jgi:formate hydrogenlyase transcriptional activator
LAGRNDLDSLVSGLADSLRSIVPFEYAALVLHDHRNGQMRGHILCEPGAASTARTLELPVDQDPAGWVWQNQRPLVIRSLEAETRWPEFRELARTGGVHALVDVPLTSGENRLGALGCGCPVPYDPTGEELAFFERVASEFAVAVEAFLAKQEVSRERDRLRTLFEITNALVSKLSPDDLFQAISQQLSRVVQLDYAVLTLRNETGGLDTYALHSPIPELSKLKMPSLPRVCQQPRCWPRASPWWRMRLTPSVIRTRFSNRLCSWDLGQFARFL